MEKPDGQEADGRRISPRPRAAKEDWWSLPTPNRRAVAYHLGRLLNQLRWHFQRSLLSVSEKDNVLKADEVSIWDEKMANAVLDRILAVSCRLANEPGTSMETTIRRVRREWVDEVFSEDVADEITDFSDEKDERGQYSGSMVQRWVEPIIDNIQKVVRQHLDSQETWLLRLGDA